MESISERVIREVELLIKEDNLLKWQEASKFLESESIGRRNLIDEIIEQTFVVSNDSFKEDKVLKITKETLQNNSVFKVIKGEVKTIKLNLVILKG